MVSNSSVVLSSSPIMSHDMKSIKKQFISEEQKQETYKKTAIEFEEMFLKHFFKHIMPQDRENGYSSKSQSEDIYKSLWTDFVSKEIAENGGIGVAEFVLKQFNKNQPPPYHAPGPINTQQRGNSYDISL